MRAKDVRAGFEYLGLSTAEVSRILGVTTRQVKRWRAGGVAGTSEILLRLWFDGKISTKDITDRRD